MRATLKLSSPSTSLLGQSLGGYDLGSLSHIANSRSNSETEFSCFQLSLPVVMSCCISSFEGKRGWETGIFYL